jgi:4-carboxymuconolactone decarboxylase
MVMVAIATTAPVRHRRLSSAAKMRDPLTHPRPQERVQPLSTADSGFRPSSPRIPVLPIDQLDDDQRRHLGTIPSDFTAVPNVVLTLLRCPDLYEAFLPLATKLLIDSGFTVRQRELVILRTAAIIDSPYEWGQHAILSSNIFEDGDLRRIVTGPSAPGWTPLEAALLSAVDELHDAAGISDATWARLGQELDEHQLIELPMLVGQYHMIAFVLHTLGVQPEEGSPGIPTPA